MIERLLAGEGALARGELDAAERLFTQVADADPRNAIAVVGLARVAQRRDDAKGARALAERALGIDPDEADANRLLTELDLPAGVEPVGVPVAVPAGVPATSAGPAAAPRRTGWRAWLDRFLRRR
jgi:hypothetical protein